MPRKEKELPRNEQTGKPPREGRPKRRRRRAPVMLILLLLLIAIIALLLYFKPFGLGGGGFGLGGNGGSGSDGNSDAPASDSSESEVSNTAVIRIDGNDIFLDGEKCADAAELEDKITAIGNAKDYELDHSTAIKSTYDEVKQVLAELENALDIKVDYNE